MMMTQKTIYVFIFQDDDDDYAGFDSMGGQDQTAGFDIGGDTVLGSQDMTTEGGLNDSLVAQPKRVCY